jgi:hypothetical protein|tara:strand:+ start:565 stop:729 length:165 start_codon:yes stop_codon:yes gene_type:complete
MLRAHTGPVSSARLDDTASGEALVVCANGVQICAFRINTGAVASGFRYEAALVA